jgi:hypothetical protein
MEFENWFAAVRPWLLPRLPDDSKPEVWEMCREKRDSSTFITEQMYQNGQNTISVSD